ncbi:hypothetical protein [Enterococcus sp. AZ103]|uniref:hypothetical protein n=1 Tax=Enterococcus sp. AZ103 TaxID=2774628 RepID=UPI003F277F93
MQVTDKNAIRKKMLVLMNQDDNWIENEAIAKEVQKLAQLLTVPPPPLPPLPKNHRERETLRRSDLLFLVYHGYNSTDIAIYYNTPTTAFSRWRKAQGFYGLTRVQILKQFSEEIDLIKKKRQLADYDIYL